jgi:hypothetical protein
VKYATLLLNELRCHAREFNLVNCDRNQFHGVNGRELDMRGFTEL